MHISKGQCGAGAQACDCERDRLWVAISSRGNEIFNIFISSLWCQATGEMRR